MLLSFLVHFYTEDTRSSQATFQPAAISLRSNCTYQIDYPDSQHEQGLQAGRCSPWSPAGCQHRSPAPWQPWHLQCWQPLWSQPRDRHHHLNRAVLALQLKLDTACNRLFLKPVERAVLAGVLSLTQSHS